MSILHKDKSVLRSVARQYNEVAQLGDHASTIEDWKKINSLKPVRPMILIDQIPWHEMNVNGELDLLCEDPLLRSLEWNMRCELYKWKHFKCDMAFFPILQVPKVYTTSGYGVDSQFDENDLLHAHVESHTYADQIPDETALSKLHVPDITFDKEATAAREALVSDLIGDIIPIRMTGLSIWAAIWDRIVFWRGAMPVLYDLVDRPEFTHQLMRKLMYIEMKLLDRLEEQNLLEQMAYIGMHSYELPGDDFDPAHVKAKNCWASGAAQIFSEVSPAMHDEFEIAYLTPYYERFGLVSYGCCEPLHNKIQIIRKIKNVRAISVSPWADVNIAAQNMGSDYVMARKPNPSFVAMESMDEKLIADDIRATLRACDIYKTPVEFILKDITTVRNDPTRLSRWYQIVKTTIDNY
ncbi:MAG: hypothetical protein ACYCZF_13695 [Anaerolineae bacterium]